MRGGRQTSTRPPLRACARSGWRSRRARLRLLTVTLRIRTRCREVVTKAKGSLVRKIEALDKRLADAHSRSFVDSEDADDQGASHNLGT